MGHGKRFLWRSKDFALLGEYERLAFHSANIEGLILVFIKRVMFSGFCRDKRCYDKSLLRDMRIDDYFFYLKKILTKCRVYILTKTIKIIKKISLKKLSLLITVFAITLIILASSALANPSSFDVKEAFNQEVKLLAHSDVKNDIPRRTEFVLKLYADSKIGQQPADIRKIYEEEYFKQYNEKFPQYLIGNPFNLIGITIIGAFILGIVLGRLLSLISKVQVKKITINIPFVNIISLELSVDSAAKKAAWLLYVELSTRIATQSLGANDGLLREALNSLYKIFETTRQILRDAGAEVGIEEKSVGGISMKVLNEGLRPFLAKWHPKLERWEAERPELSSHQAHEQQWTDFTLMRNELELLRQGLQEYADMLGKIAALKD